MKDDKELANNRQGPGPESERPIRSSYIPGIGKKNRQVKRNDAVKRRVAARDRLKAGREAEELEGLANHLAGK